jgi:hypothetical protein
MRHGQEDAMTKVRLSMIVGFTAIAAMMTVDASAQDCPEWLKWLCSGSASSNAVNREGFREDKQASRTKPTSRSANQARPAAADTAKSQQTQARDPAPPARLHPAMSDGEKEALFMQFLEWDKARRSNAETNR